MIHLFLDRWNLPVTRELDGGDSAAEAGTLMALDPSIEFNVAHYLQAHGPVRHPDKDKWYGRPGRFSRDQLIALMCGLCMSSHYWDEKEDLYAMHKRNWFVRAWNKIRNFQYETAAEQVAKAPGVQWNPWPKQPDVTGPEVWALWLRMWPRWWKWPFILLCDLETLVGALVWRFRKDGLARNHLLILYVGTSVMPTPVMWLARSLTYVNHLAFIWGAHCRDTGAIDTSELFYQAFRR